MRLPALIALSLVLSQPVLAETIETSSVVSAVVGDFNKDGAQDLAMLVRGEDAMDLHLLLGVEGRGYLEPADVVKGQIWGEAGPDSLVGQEPYLETLPNGSLAVNTRNDAVGRGRWNQKLTLAYSNNALVVAGFSYIWRDTIDPDNAGQCDINILTGKGIRETLPETGDPVRTRIAIKGEQTPYATWSDSNAISACNPG
ncbi:hypothetical protein M2360_002168 [Rhizobium sp. SG_E_25_P2]|uniref:hypothetical protein n=1 Tax=Rhizobium sp. SG_E_25_P2 TaxID=2879942 RepID=UPI002476045E|nr:hypothetical protein [Rhizobium sp. SG_E_25_P2]MDH6266772.1 hypothetical protein [Rhizobium sp. SG_E_25_P2]